jgi:hypothetical protein
VNLAEPDCDFDGLSVFVVGTGTFALVLDTAGHGCLGGVGFPVVGELKVLVLLCFGQLVALWP